MLMKRLLQNFTSILLAVVLFITTSGFSIYSHLCTISGDKDYSVSQLEPCCSSDTQQSSADFQKESCCQTDHQLIKLEVNAPQINKDILPVLVGHYFAIPEYQANLSSCRDQGIFLFENLPPPKTGKTILITNQVFRI